MFIYFYHAKALFSPPQGTSMWRTEQFITAPVTTQPIVFLKKQNKKTLLRHKIKLLPLFQVIIAEQ